MSETRIGAPGGVKPYNPAASRGAGGAASSTQTMAGPIDPGLSLGGAAEPTRKRAYHTSSAAALPTADAAGHRPPAQPSPGPTGATTGGTAGGNSAATSAGNVNPWGPSPPQSASMGVSGSGKGTARGVPEDASTTDASRYTVQVSTPAYTGDPTGETGTGYKPRDQQFATVRGVDEDASTTVANDWLSAGPTNPPSVLWTPRQIAGMASSSGPARALHTSARACYYGTYVVACPLCSAAGYHSSAAALAAAPQSKQTTTGKGARSDVPQVSTATATYGTPFGRSNAGTSAGASTSYNEEGVDVSELDVAESTGAAPPSASNVDRDAIYSHAPPQAEVKGLRYGTPAPSAASHAGGKPPSATSAWSQ